VIEPGVPLDLPDDYNAAVDLIGRNQTGGRESGVAIIDHRGSTTYGELAELVDRAGNALLALGLRREDRVALALLDTVDFPTVFWGAIKAGIVPVCLNTLLTSDNYDYITNDCRARVLVVSEELLERFEPVLDGHPWIEQVAVSSVERPEPGDGHARLTDLLSEASPELVPAATKRDEVAFWLYSSGSTGTPKGVMHVHGSLAQTAHLCGSGVIGIESSDVVFSAAKLFFAYGLGNAMTFPFWAGATSVLLDGRPTPDAVSTILSEHRPTVFYGVPTLYAALLADPEFGPATSTDSLRRCISAGEALPESIGVEWQRRFGREILDGIGSTEMLHVFVSNRPGDVRYGWSGRPVPGYDARIVDEGGDDVPDGEIGELLIRGSSAAAQYWNLRDKSRATFVGEWTRTGDKYLRDQDGYYLYCGRTDDMFKVGGNWVSPFEVESAVAGHDAVVEAAVIARPDDTGNLKPLAFVVAARGVTGGEDLAGDIQTHVKQHLEPWKYPRWIEFVDDLPKTATGKIQRYKLRERIG
jgi:benzoate-CoA ligase family protein